MAAKSNDLDAAAVWYRKAFDLNSEERLFWDYFAHSLKEKRRPLDLLVDVLELLGTKEAVEEMRARKLQREEMIRQEEELRQQTLKETKEIAQVG